uniref:Uncharacterized protein n=1 Tax=Parascaris equorum TaxID=6256 RepID=A0A914R1N6_PAREQ
MLPTRVFDVDIYPYGSYLMEDREESELSTAADKIVAVADALAFKVVEVGIVALKNRFADVLLLLSSMMNADRLLIERPWT